MGKYDRLAELERGASRGDWYYESDRIKGHGRRVVVKAGAMYGRDADFVIEMRNAAPGLIRDAALAQRWALWAQRLDQALAHDHAAMGAMEIEQEELLAMSRAAGLLPKADR